MKKRLLTVALAAVLALSLAACTGGSKSGNSSSESQWKLCNRNKNKAYCKQNIN